MLLLVFQKKQKKIAPPFAHRLTAGDWLLINELQSSTSSEYACTHTRVHRYIVHDSIHTDLQSIHDSINTRQLDAGR